MKMVACLDLDAVVSVNIPNAIRFGNLRWSEGATERGSDRAHESGTSGANPQRYTLNPCYCVCQTRSLFGAISTRPRPVPGFSGKRHLNRPAKPAHQHPPSGLNLQPLNLHHQFSRTTSFRAYRSSSIDHRPICRKARPCPSVLHDHAARHMIADRQQKCHHTARCNGISCTRLSANGTRAQASTNWSIRADSRPAISSMLPMPCTL